MKNPNDSFLIGRLKSLKFAIRGAWLLITTEHSIMVQFSLGILITILGFFMNISANEWMFQSLAIGMVLVAESLNTGIEKLCDFVHPNFHKKIGFIKDISAGAATFAAITAIVIGMIIYLPKFI
ncbi:MAG: diacylglycerol kinase family protein [Flavobacteriaceae bacterium]|nr:diacylglycerol kinase family protein [Flavobacteriaceae bacterium]